MPGSGRYRDAPDEIHNVLENSAMPRDALFQPELLDLARDGVAADAQLVRRLDTAPQRVLQGGEDQARFEPAGEHLPHVVAAAREQGVRLGLQRRFPGAGGGRGDATGD